MSTPTIKDIRAAAAARKQSRERRRKLLVGTVVLVLLLGTGVFFGIPPVVESQLKSRLERMLQREVQVGTVSFNLLTLRTTFEDVRVPDHDGSEFITWDRLVLDARLSGVMAGAWSIDAIMIEGFSARLMVDKQGRLNIADVMTALAADEAGGRPFEVGEFSVTDAQLVWIDASREQPFETTLGPVTFSLSNLHTKSDPDSPYEFEAVTESGESLVWDGTLSVSPFRSQGRWEMRGLRVSKYEPYLDGISPLEFTSGVIDASSSYAIRWVDGALSYQLSEGEFAVAELRASSGAESDEAQSFGELTVQGLEFDSTQRSLRIDRVLMGGGRVSVQRDQEGWSWLGVTLGDGVTRDTDTPGMGWKAARIDELELSEIDVHINDLTAASPVEIDAKISRATMERWDLMRLGQPADVTIDAALSTGGTVSLRGALAVRPFQSDFEYELRDVAWAGVAPFRTESSGASMRRGSVSARGEFRGSSEAYEISGSGRIADLVVADSQGQESFRARLAEFTQFSVSPKSSTIRIETLALTEPRARWEILESGEWGWRQNKTPPAVELPGAVSRSWDIDTIDIAGGVIEFRDESAFRPVELSASELEGAFTGWTSRDSRTAKVELTGVLEGESPVSIEGGFNPLAENIFADVKIRARELPAPAFNGYTSRYLGYEFTGGSIALDVDAKLRDGMIESETVTGIERVTWGKKIASPEVTNVPVKLAWSLLRDAEEKVVVAVPVSGRITDPEFSYGRVANRALANLWTNVVSSPFAFLGSGGREEAIGSQLQNYAFMAGEANMYPEAIEHLDQLAKLLVDRPMLRFKLSAGYDRQEDRAKLLPAALDRELRRLAMAGSFDAHGNWNSSSRIQALVGLYQETFNELPIDPDGELPPPAPPKGDESVPPPETQAEQEKRSLLAWLRWLFAAEGISAEAESENKAISAEPPAGSFRAPEGMRKELPILPVEEIASRLLAEQTVSATQLRDLGRARIEAVRRHLERAGIDPNRLVVGAIESGSTMVTLSLL